MLALRRALLTPLTGLLLAGCLGDSTPAEDAEAPAAPDPTPRIVLETNRGNIVVELFRDDAPLAVENFLLHVRSRFYNDLTFHRVRPGFVQAGLLMTDMRERITGAPPIRSEAANGLKNVRGTLAMARTEDPHSARSQFFINVADNAQFDFTDSTSSGGWGYAVFGHVVEGMDVVDAIARTRTRPRGRHQNVPVEPIVITQAYIAPEGDAQAETN